METLSKSKYFYNDFDLNTSLFVCGVYPESASMSEEEYKAEINKLIALLEDHKPKYVIGHMQQMNFAITPEVQEWLDQNLFACYERIGISRLALVLSKDLFTAVSIEQTMDDKTVASFETMNFDDYDKAKTWILG